MEKEQNTDDEKEHIEIRNELEVQDISGQEHVIQPGSTSEGERGEEEVHVIYLNVPETDEPQVLDLSNLLVHEGIQIVEPSKSTDQISSIQGIGVTQDIVIENNSGTEITMVASQSDSEAQSAHALLHLAKSQSEEQEVQVSEILAAQRQSEHIMEEEQDATSAEALLQLSSDPNGGTYIVDENGSMIPLSQVRSATLLEVDDTAVTTDALFHCWCGREFISQEDLDRHVLAHKYQSQPSKIAFGEQKCVLCDEKFSTHKELKDHHSEVHPGGVPWECNVCSRKFSKKIALKAHMRVHNIMTRYQCSACKKMFYYKTALNRHLKMHTCDKPFKCTICGDLFHTLWDLRKHRMNHQTPKLFSCDVCTKVFRQKQTLFVHSRIHTGQRPYSCDICQRSFSLKSTLVQHRRIHTGEKPNICPVCHRGFRQNSTLKSHLKIHTNLKPYMCRYCKMRFAYSDEVAEHEHTHIHNKNWQCDDCGMRFKNQSLLQRHTRVHTNERPFECHICLKTFVQSGSLQAHMRSHTKERPYQCRMCSKAYSTSGTLLIHIRKAHNVDAKSVKEVFPVFNYIEDQKVFTIRNKPLMNTEDVSLEVDQEKESKTAESEIGDLLSKDNMIVEELIETTGEIIVQDSKVLIEKTNSSASVTATESQPLEAPASNDIESRNTKIEDSNSEVPVESKTQNAGDQKSFEKEDSEENKEDSHNSHAAHDRQEAALGLAELALIGGEGLQIEKPQPQKLRTFFKEEEEDENDPNVTKIILSKEGGIMNSQDPHQCPVCGRIFGRKSIMVEHLRIHTDEKPYECDFCKSAFRQNAQLRSHIRNKHTQVERYQCSFCHKRFLSRNITVKHINFHHKLKVKFCESVDPAWTIDSAVWCDANFELNVRDPQFLKNTNKKVKKSIITISKNSSGNPVVGAQPETVEQQSDPVADPCPQGDITKDLSRNVSVRTSEINTDTSEAIGETVSTKTEENQQVTDVISSAKGKKVMTSRGNQAALSAEDAEQESPQEAQAITSLSGIKSISDTDFGSSRLLCGTCSMQFRGISSLRYHLRKVHNTTLDQSDVSYVFEDEKSGTEHTTVTLNADVVSNQEVETQEIETIEIGDGTAENLPLKVIVYDDTSKCVDDPKFMPHKCSMCTVRCSNKVELEEHMKNHTEEEVESVGMHQCDLCSSVLKNTQQITKHILKFHGVKQIYVCSICHREFFQQSSVHRHMKFFHKWEMKIRGEASIPILTKPAPSSIQNPTASPKVRVRKETMIQHGRQIPSVKRTVKQKKSEDENKMTYISLKVGDMDNLQIYRPDGKEINFEVVSTKENVKTLKITEEELDKALEESSAADGNDDNTSVFVLASPQTEPGSLSVEKNSFEGINSSSEQGINPSGSTISQHNVDSTDPSSLMVVGNDKGAPISISKEIVDQLLKQLNSYPNDDTHVIKGSKEIKLKPVENDGGSLQIESGISEENMASVVNINSKKSNKSPGHVRQGVSSIKVLRSNINSDMNSTPVSKLLNRISPCSTEKGAVVQSNMTEKRIPLQFFNDKSVVGIEGKCDDPVTLEVSDIPSVDQPIEKSTQEIVSNEITVSNAEKSQAVVSSLEDSQAPIVMSIQDIGRRLNKGKTVIRQKEIRLQHPTQSSVNRTGNAAKFTVLALDSDTGSSQNLWKEKERENSEVEKMVHQAYQVNKEVGGRTLSPGPDIIPGKTEITKLEISSASNLGTVVCEEIGTVVTISDQDVSQAQKVETDDPAFQSCETRNNSTLKIDAIRAPVVDHHITIESVASKSRKKIPLSIKKEVEMKMCNTAKDEITTKRGKTVKVLNKNTAPGKAKGSISPKKEKNMKVLSEQSVSKSGSEGKKLQILEEKGPTLQSKKGTTVSEKGADGRTVTNSSKTTVKVGKKNVDMSNISKKVDSPDNEEPVTERRSSSGRLIKKKKFDDEIKEFTSPKKRKR